MSNRLSVQDIVAMKQRGERIAALTAYDYTSARILDATDISLILIGDTVGVVVQGAQSTLRVSLEHIIYHSQLVARGSRRALLVGDMPFMTYQISADEALRNAARLVCEGNVGAVKLEGGSTVCATIERLVRAGIPVCGHLGYTPQSANTQGRPRIQGRQPADAVRLIREARALESAGAFAVVLELMPSSVARQISVQLSIPTIGIGAGPHCDGEIQVFHDLLGLYTDFVPRHTRRYLDAADLMSAAAKLYVNDVRSRSFPGPEQTSDLSHEARSQLESPLRT